MLINKKLKYLEEPFYTKNDSIDKKIKKHKYWNSDINKKARNRVHMYGKKKNYMYSFYLDKEIEVE